MNQGFNHLQLSEADAEMLDKLVDVGFELSQLEYLTNEDEQRARSILAKLGLLEAYPVEDASDTLIDATLARIDQYESKRAARMQVVVPELETTKRGFRLRMPDLIGTAAAILLSVALLAMFSNFYRAQSINNQCASNMAMVGHGLVNYALDNNSEMPTTQAPAVASVFGGLIPERINPDVLVHQGYCEENHLNCPGHGDDRHGFSYQTQPAEIWDKIRNHGRFLIIMSDRNPILEKMLQGKQFNPLTLSQNHGSLGQNHLRDDGSTASLPVPVHGGDLIWILDGKNRGIDIFLTH
ncbi:MAG: hypothetical protein QF718_07350 [Phycisphaerales bacterium]|jgi:hypothetical protein|nr:hypothetical protein [Phycisphaerales bacterium]